MCAKYAFFTNFIAALALSSSLAAWAQKPNTPPETIVAYPPNSSSASKNPRAQRNPSRSQKHRLDLDRDGFVSKAELEQNQQQHQSAFLEADQNADGRLNADEARRFQQIVKEKFRKRKR
jgi:hypothetical protein